MSMSHKAFLFDYGRFEQEIEPLLRKGLDGNPSLLEDYIAANLAQLKDPYEGESLGKDWREQWPVDTPEELADFVLTACYDPGLDIGLGDAWWDADRILNEGDELVAGILLGRTLQVNGKFFNPGKQGTYFQSPDRVDTHLRLVERLVEAAPEYQETLQPVIDLFQTAVEHRSGLYITF